MNYRNFKTIAIHSLFWIAFIASESMTILFAGLKYPWFLYFIFYPIYISFFYFTAHSLLFFRKRNLSNWLPVLFLVIAIFEILLVLELENLFKPISLRVSLVVLIERQMYWGVLLRVMKYALFSIGYYWALLSVYNQSIASEAKIKRVEAERNLVDLENAYLKAQLKPHMLFNTLSLLHSADSNRNETSDKVISLVAEQMRYALEQPGEDGKIALDKEILQVENMVQLYRLRFPNLKLQVELNIADKASDLRIPPMILTTLVENVFKHGAFAKATKYAKIVITISGRQLFMQTQNEKRGVPRTESNRLGLNNTITILRNHYPDNPQALVLLDEENHFTTILNVVL